VRVTAPSDKRFKRAQAKPSRKRTGWARLRVRALRTLLVLAVLGYGGYRAYALLHRTTFLQVRRIVIRGNERLSNGEVLALVDGVRGTNILLVDLAEWRRRVMSSPWVAEAHLHRELPGTIEIAVVERKPVGIGRLGGELFLVDGSGVIVDQYGPNYVEFDLPIIDGLAAGDPGGPMVDPARAQLAARVVFALQARQDLARRVSQIDVSDVRDAVVVLEGETALLRLGDDQFAERLQSYIDLASALHEQVPAIDYVDLRYDDRIYVRPASDGRRGPVTSAAGGRRAPSTPAKAAKPG
jgi:cell division protein FtsQ